MIRRLIAISLLLISGTHVVSAQQKKRLNENWEFLKQDIGGIWEAVRPIVKGNPESVPLWDSVSLPHCVNAIDAVDPDVNYYQGPAWYRTQIVISNPYAAGRTLLHFEGAGQKTEVFIYTTKVGAHVGGYDEWTVDITDAVKLFQSTDTYQKQFKGKIPVSIRTDNSRDLEMIPSSLSDFNVYGGIYRYLNLVYVPRVSVDKLFVSTETDKAGKTGLLKVKARFYNPTNVSSAEMDISLNDPSGKSTQKQKIKLNTLEGDQSIATFEVKLPKLWSPETPLLYSIEATLTTLDGASKIKEKVGFRNFEFVDKGPFMLNGKRLLLRGTHRHEDHAGVAAAMTESMIRTEM